MVVFDLENMSDDELYKLVENAQTELGKRQTRDVFDRELAEVVQKGRESGIIETPEVGEEWQQPSGAHDSYAHGDIVTHDNKQWVSTVTPNVWEPGVSGWREHAVLDPETGEPQYPDYNPPTGAHDAYNTGERITWNGQVYEATQDGVVWSPEEYPPAWNLVTDDEEPEDEPVDDEPAELPEWDGNSHNYTTGDTFTYEGTPYRVRQNHTSQPTWLPDQVPALYEPGTITGGE